MLNNPSFNLFRQQPDEQGEDEFEDDLTATRAQDLPSDSELSNFPSNQDLHYSSSLPQLNRARQVPPESSMPANRSKSFRSGLEADPPTL